MVSPQNSANTTTSRNEDDTSSVKSAKLTPPEVATVTRLENTPLPLLPLSEVRPNSNAMSTTSGNATMQASAIRVRGRLAWRRSSVSTEKVVGVRRAGVAAGTAVVESRDD